MIRRESQCTGVGALPIAETRQGLFGYRLTMCLPFVNVSSCDEVVVRKIRDKTCLETTYILTRSKWVGQFRHCSFYCGLPLHSRRNNNGWTTARPRFRGRPMENPTCQHRHPEHRMASLICPECGQ